MSTREQFEKWWGSMAEVQWKTLQVNLIAEIAWKASRAAALEEAANVAEEYEFSGGGHHVIRALAKDGGD